MPSYSKCHFRVLPRLLFLISQSTSNSNDLFHSPNSPKNTITQTHTVCLTQLIYCFFHAQHYHQSISSLLSWSCTPHVALIMDHPALHKISLQFVSGTILLSYMELLALNYSCKLFPFSFIQNLLSYGDSPHFPSIAHPHLTVAVTAASHPPPTHTQSQQPHILHLHTPSHSSLSSSTYTHPVTAASHPPPTHTQSSKYVNSLTVFTSSYNFILHFSHFNISLTYSASKIM